MPPNEHPRTPGRSAAGASPRCLLHRCGFREGPSCACPWDVARFWQQIDVALRGGSRQLAAAVEDRRAVTFGDLRDRVDEPIDLYVVTFDLQASEPVVLSHHNHEAMSVASAVLASCAMPLAFPYALGIREDDPDTLWRLVDEGVIPIFRSLSLRTQRFAAISICHRLRAVFESWRSRSVRPSTTTP